MIYFGWNMFKFMMMVILAETVFVSCQKQKEAVGIDTAANEESLVAEVLLNHPGENAVVGNNASVQDFEDVMWQDEDSLIGFPFFKRILFHRGSFTVYDDISTRRTMADGQYIIDSDGRIVCRILNRRIAEPSDSSWYDVFLDYYKLFLENDTVTFTVKHDPNLYRRQWQFTSDPGGEVYTNSSKNRYDKADNIYDNDGVELYKYDGGIKRCVDRLNVREKPSLDAKILYVMEVGEHVRIAARTTGTEKIDNREDYWYYGNYNADDYIPVYGYFFGAYLGEDNDDGKKWTPP
jgi:hypothetical protein